MKIHLVISMTQLEFVSNDFYNRLRSDHLDSMFVEEDILINKFYEMKKVLVKRIRKYENFNADQYLIRWKEYESKFDEWKNLSDLKNCIDLIKNFEKEEKTHQKKTKKTRFSEKHVNSLSTRTRSSTKRVTNQSQH
jgi:hypothetical protein